MCLSLSVPQLTGDSGCQIALNFFFHQWDTNLGGACQNLERFIKKCGGGRRTSLKVFQF